MLVVWFAIAFVVAAIAISAGVVTPVGSWLLLSTFCVMGSGLCGFYSIKVDGCGLTESRNVAKDRTECSWGSALATIVLLILFRAQEIFNVIIDTAHAIGVPVWLAMVVTCAIFGTISGIAAYLGFNVCKRIAVRRLKKIAGQQFAICNDAKGDPEDAADCCEHCARAHAGRCPLDLQETAKQALKGYEITITAKRLPRSQRLARTAVKPSMVTVQADDIIKGMAKAETIFASQAKTGELQMCALQVEGTWNTGEMDPQEVEAFRQLQDKELNLPLVH